MSWGCKNIHEGALYPQTLTDLLLNHLSLAPKPAKLCDLCLLTRWSVHTFLSTTIFSKYNWKRGKKLKQKKKGIPRAQQREPFFFFWQWCATPWQAALLVNVVSTLELSMTFVMCLSWLAPWVTLASKAAFPLTACWGYRCLDNR